MVEDKGKKQLCGCSKKNIATYAYLPGFIDNSNPYFCEDCISDVDSIPCSCNYHYTKYQKPEGIENIDWRWISSKKDIFINLDERGRPYPCCEYDYSENGYDLDDRF